MVKFKTPNITIDSHLLILGKSFGKTNRAPNKLNDCLHPTTTIISTPLPYNGATGTGCIQNTHAHSCLFISPSNLSPEFAHLPIHSNQLSSLVNLLSKATSTEGICNKM